MEDIREDETLIQNLLDTGLCQKELDQFLICHRQKRQVAQMQILNKYRGELLSVVQDNQEKLYRLDFVIRKLREKK